MSRTPHLVLVDPSAPRRSALRGRMLAVLVGGALAAAGALPLLLPLLP